MNSPIVLMYLGAAAMVGLLSAFAAHNRKTGWTRPRPTFVESLNNFYVDLGLDVSLELTPVPVEVPVMRSPTPDELVDFSAQLLKMRAALGSSAPLAVSGRDALVRQLVTK